MDQISWINQVSQIHDKLEDKSNKSKDVEKMSQLSKKMSWKRNQLSQNICQINICQIMSKYKSSKLNN